jgi:sucrose phosphatase-like protein
VDEKRLLATDLDGTFIGDDEAMFDLWEALQSHGIIVAFSTGRHLRSIQDFYDRKQTMRRADVCVCMVGTDIYFRPGEDYVLDGRWHETIRDAWDRAAVDRIVRAIPEARMQDEQWQSAFKCSYDLEENAEARLAEIRAGLKSAGLQAKVIYSVGKFLDLLPVRSGKGEAIRYTAAKLGIPAANVVTCGDSGNDIDMMRSELGFHSIVVGNAEPELKALTGPRVYHANAPFARGIQEGLERVGWL